MNEPLRSSCTWRDLNPHPSNMDMNLNHARMPIPPQVPDPVPLSQHFIMIIQIAVSVKRKIIKDIKSGK